MFKKKGILICVISLVVLLSTGLIFFIYTCCLPRFYVKNFNGVVSKVYSDELDIKNVCYGNIFKCRNINPEINGEYEADKVGTYDVEYVFKYKNHTYTKTGVLNVVDNEGPVLTKSEEDIEVCPNNGKILKGGVTAIDSYDGDLSDKIVFFYDKETNKLHTSVSDFSSNKTEYSFNVVASDTEPPVITMNGDASVSLTNGSNYGDQGASAIDNCDGGVEVSVQNPVDTKKDGTYLVVYTAKDSSGNVSEVKRTVKVYTPQPASVSYTCNKVGYSCKGSGKVIYLTFDDGPSGYTAELLDVLKKYGVKATFFVTGNGSDASIKREYDEGHTVALHTYSHNYSSVYASVDAYFYDLQRISDRVERITGQKSYIVRFPGGSSNTVSRSTKCIMSTLSRELEKRGYVYYDWNVSSGDAGATTDTNQVFNNVVRNLGSGRYVVLQHDSKGYSVKAVERIIQYGLNNGYTFERLSKDSMVCHHATAN